VGFTDGAPKYFYFPPDKRLKLCHDLELETNELQDKIVADPKRHVIFRAARRVGKSFTAAKRHFPMSLTPKSIHWIVGPTYDLAHKEFRYWLDFLLKLQAKLGKKCIQSVFEQPASGQLSIKTSWGSLVLGKSAANPQSLLGEALDSALYAEAAQLTRDVRERYVRPALATKEGYETFATTPDSAGLWLYELELMAAGLSDAWSIYNMPAWECPHYSQEEIADAKRELSEDAFYEQYGGEWRFYTGRVYKIFKPDVHLVDPFTIPQSWEIGSGIDFGSRDPMVAEIAAKSPTGEVYFFGEYYEQRQELATQDHCAQIIRTEQQLGIKAGRITRVADHHGLGRQLITDASRAGMPCIPCASKDRRARRDCAMSAFTPHDGEHPYHARESGLPPGKYPKVFIMKGRCPNLIRELQFLRWRDSDAKKEGAMNDTVGDDHAVDAMEYRLERWQTGRVARFRRAGNANTGVSVMDKTGYYSKMTGPVARRPWQNVGRGR
jgi:hypothetical protein